MIDVLRRKVLSVFRESNRNDNTKKKVYCFVFVLVRYV